MLQPRLTRPASRPPTHPYRIAQEAVTNAIKHSRARQIRIGLWASARLTVLSVEDDGVGFSDAPPETKGMGLRIMRNRASLISGTLVTKNKNGGGVEIACTLQAAPPRMALAPPPSPVAGHGSRR